ncbi:hypothetical protein LINPERHAP2_LOCUS15743, partial [Linum perenne]
EDNDLNPRCPRVQLSEDEVRNFLKPWSKALVVKVMEKSFTFNIVKRRLEAIWARAGTIQVFDVANSFFLVKFSDLDDYHRSAFESPWKIFDYYFAISRWTPDFNEEPIKSVLTWVRLPKLPIHYFNRLAVTHIGNYIGKTVRLDLATSQGARACSAHVCVEVDLSKPLLGKYMIDDRTFCVEYESLEDICYTCGYYGNKLDTCLTNKPQAEANVEESTASQTTVTQEEEDDTGQWMTISRRQKRKPNKGAQSTKEPISYGSTFNVLQVDATDASAPPKPTNNRSENKTMDEIIAEHADKLQRILKRLDWKVRKMSRLILLKFSLLVDR